MSFWSAVGKFFLDVGKAVVSYAVNNPVSFTLQSATLIVGVKGFMQARQMQAKGQDILANKTSAGGKLPVIYGTRRVGAQVIYMDVSANDSRDLYVVYALSVGECDEIIGRTIELDGNPLTDTARFRDGGYIGSDKITSGNYSLNTVSQNGTGIDAGAGQFGTSPTQKYRYVMNLHHGAATQTADPMLVASMPNWTIAHKLNGVAYIAAHYGYDKEGIWSGVPQLTVQVRGKKVFDPRDTNQTFGDISTYEYSDNPALTFLDYITNNEYGKGLTQSQINMSTFTAAANVCDTQVDQPYFNGSTQSLTWSGNAGDDFITIGGADPNTNWWQNKVGEVVDINDANGNLIVDGKEIKDVQRNGFYDQNDEYIVYINDTLGSTYSSQTGSSLVKVKRFHCNGYLDSNKNVMDNAKELLANMRGIFLYIDGKYELSIEDTGTSTFSINDNHIIADAGISVDYGNKDKKANKVIVEFFNANKKYELDTATVLHDATPEYYSDDGDEILEIKAEFPYISDPYIAYNMGKAILTRSRNQTTMQFLGTPEMYKLNVGDIVDLTYAGLGFSGKVCRVEALELQPNGLVAVSLIEYFDVYTWEVPPQEPVEELANLPSAYAVKAPTGLSFTDTDSSATGRPFLSWNEPTDFPNYQYRVNVVDSSSNQVLNRIVDVENCDLNFIPKGTNYVASVTSLNTLGTESSSANLTFSVADEPTVAADIKDGSITTVKIADDAVSTAKIIDDAVTNALIATDAVNQDSIAANSVTASEILANTITASQIAASTITAGEIASNTITATQMAADSITATEIDVTNLSAISADLGSITAGNMNIGSGAFTVSSSGVMTATGATISGGITATSLNVTNATVTGTLDASVITLNSEPLDSVLTYSESGGIGLLTLNEGAAIDGDFVVAGNFEATGTQPDLIVGKVTGISSDTVQADAILRSSTGSGGFRIQAGSGNTQVVGLVYDAVGGTTLSADGGASGTFKINADGALAVTFDSSQNATFTGEITADALGLPSNTPSTTTNKLYNVGGSLYFNGSAVGGGGTGDITAVTAGTNLNGGGTSGAVTLNLDNTISITGTISSGATTTTSDTFNKIYSVSDQTNAGIEFSSHSPSRGQKGNIFFQHGNTLSYGTGAAFTINSTETLTVLADGNLMFKDGLYVKPSSGTGAGTQIIDSSRNLLNIGTISSGAINTTGITIDGRLVLDGSKIYDNSTNGNSKGFRIGGSGLVPLNGVGTDINNVVDIGTATYKFKDLYLSGTISSGAITSSSTGTFTSNVTANGVTIGASDVRSSSNILTIGGTSEVVRIHSGNFDLTSGVHKVGGTTVIDASRNLTNIGTISQVGAVSLNSNSLSDPDSTSRTNYPAGQMLTHYSEANGVSIIGGQGGYTGCGLTIGEETGRSANFKLIRGISDTNGSPAEEFSIDGVGNATFAGTLSAGFTHLYKTGSGQTIVAVIGSDSTRPVLQFSESTATTINAGMSLEYNGTGSGDANFMSINAVTGSSMFQFSSGGDFRIGSTTVIDSSRNLTNIANATVTRLKAGADFGNYPISASSSQKYAIGFRNTSATNGSTNYPWLAHDSDKFIIHWNAIGDRWSLDQSGNTVNSGNVTAYSDKRLKENIQTLDSKKALQMRGVSFIKDGVEGSGVIAQEIEEIAPELVITADDEMGTKSVAYGNLVGYLIETVKDQQKQIDELKQRLDNDSSN